MDKANYKIGLYGLYDKVKQEVKFIGMNNNIACYTRDIIPIINGEIPLNDVDIMVLGEINPFTGEIAKNEESGMHYNWEELYKFKFTNKANEADKKGEVAKVEEAQGEN